MPTSKVKLRKLRKRREHQTGMGRFFNLNTPILPDALRWVLLIVGVAMILGAVIAWPLSVNPHQNLLGLGGGVLVIFAFFGVRRTLGNVLKLLAKLGI